MIRCEMIKPLILGKRLYCSFDIAVFIIKCIHIHDHKYTHIYIHLFGIYYKGNLVEFALYNRRNSQKNEFLLRGLLHNKESQNYSGTGGNYKSDIYINLTMIRAIFYKIIIMIFFIWLYFFMFFYEFRYFWAEFSHLLRGPIIHGLLFGIPGPPLRA